ncbi:calpain-1 catalytic subunit-like isoform X2 [Micropterus dolomieu]|uniref:calpain-1 catalytic subunit-like isoform X2 n=1 Tax=Micropterus dolomieu TaxID=147949 RepID=UPI001E8D3712|nr:calpain-1 catalytic subunit-like isoform X2 [Micropterus dolomieu]
MGWDLRKPLVNMTESGTCPSVIILRYQDGSEGCPSNPARFNNQDYVQLKDHHLRKGTLFEDTTFPPNSRSLGDMSKLNLKDKVEWLRPAEILKRQKIIGEPIFCDGASRFDYGQGNLGDCWFLSAISSLTFQEDLVKEIVHIEQSFINYAGIFHFKFWRFGKWVDVVIDDLLPTCNNKLVFVHPKNGNEFWVPLLEKAYAKVCGSYSYIWGGFPSDACKDFSGGVHMTKKLREAQTAGHEIELWLALSRAFQCKSMVCCWTASIGDKLENNIAHTGLINKHAYSVTAVTEVVYGGSKVKLVRVMNPHGKTEWNGNWSDNSDLWTKVNQEDWKNHLNLNNGEFWMELKDFCHYFSRVSICCESPNFIDGDFTCQWTCMIHDGNWVAGTSSGGSPNHSTFATNPQYRIQVTNIDKEEQGDKNVFLSLMQKPLQDLTKKTFLFIGLAVYQVPAGTPQGCLKSSFFKSNTPLKQPPAYTAERELIEQHSLQPGEYVIVPFTEKANTADFVLSVYTKTDATIT